MPKTLKDILLDWRGTTKPSYEVPIMMTQDLRKELIAWIKEIEKEMEALKIGAMLDLSELSEAAGISEKQRRASCEAPYYENRGKIEFIKHFGNIKKEDLK